MPELIKSQESFRVRQSTLPSKTISAPLVTALPHDKLEEAERSESGPRCRLRRPRASGGPVPQAKSRLPWVPAFAGMTKKEVGTKR